jgi:ABC-type lipoprotein release transport system permease subunit
LEINGVTFSEEIVRDAGMPMASTFYADFSVETVVTVFIMGLLMALFGALIPALRASFIQPVDAMRRKR